MNPTQDAHEADASAYLWHNFTDMARLAREGPKIIVEGSGAIVKDAGGKTYIDGMAGMETTAVGHGREELARAAYDQMVKLEYYHIFGFTNVPATMLARKLADLAPGNLKKVFFVSGGSEGCDTALKFARQYHALVCGNARRYKVISRHRSYHGMTFGGLSANGHMAQRVRFEPLLPGFSFIPAPYCYRCPYDLSYPDCSVRCARELEKEILFQGAETVSAFMAEPVMGAAAGVLIPPNEYFQVIRETCSRYGVLLILDEVITGFGRTGRRFACEHWGIVPDIMVVAKGVTSGYLPLGAVLVDRSIADAVDGSSPERFMHGFTYGGHPTCCAVALKNIEILEREGLIDRARELGAYLLKGLQGLATSPLIGDVRGLGMVFCLEIVRDKASKERFPASMGVGQLIRDRAYEKGLICRDEGDLIILCPPFVLTYEQADQVVEILSESLREVERQVEERVG